MNNYGNCFFFPQDENYCSCGPLVVYCVDRIALYFFKTKNGPKFTFSCIFSSCLHPSVFISTLLHLNIYCLCFQSPAYVYTSIILIKGPTASRKQTNKKTALSYQTYSVNSGNISVIYSACIRS